MLPTVTVYLTLTHNCHNTHYKQNYANIQMLTKCDVHYCLPRSDTTQFTRSVEWKRNLVAHGDAREEKWRGKRRMEWVAKQASVWLRTVHPVLLQSLSADPHSKKASTRLNWHPRRYKWTRPFRWKTESGFCACAITFRLHSTSTSVAIWHLHLEGIYLPSSCNLTFQGPLYKTCGVFFGYWGLAGGGVWRTRSHLFQ